MVCKKKVVPLWARKFFTHMVQDTKEINIRAWVLRILNNWYWFALCAILLGLYGLYDYMSTTNKYEVKSEIILRGTDNGSAFMQSELVDLLGLKGNRSVDDEIVVFTSRDAISRVVTDLNLQVEYRKKMGLRWVGQYSANDLELNCSDGFLRRLQRATVVTIKVRKNDYVVRVKYGRYERSRHIVDNLQDPFMTCAGRLSINVANPKDVERNDQYRITMYPLLSAVNKYKHHIQVAAVQKNSNVIEIKSTTDIPQRSLDIIQGMIDVYNADAIADKNLVAQNTAMFIEERINAVEEELKQAEASTVQFLAKHGYVDPIKEAEVFFSEEVGYRQQLVDVETQISMIDFLCESMNQNLNNDSLLPVVFVNPVSYRTTSQGGTSSTYNSESALMTSIEEYNALMLKKMRMARGSAGQDSQNAQLESELLALRSSIMTTLNNLRATLLISQQNLEKHFNAADQYRHDMPDHVRTYEVMFREKKLKEKLYLFICEQREENALILASTVLPIKVVTTPQLIPLRVSPKRSAMLIFILIGLFIPLGVMIAYDIMNNRISSERKNLEQRIKMPLLGAIARNTKDGFLIMREGNNSTSAELFRTLRTNLQFLQSKDIKCPVALVTSSMDNEGKSYVATNLAVSLALLGKKVALVELDFRKPTLAKGLDLPSQGRLATYLADASYSVNDVVVPTSIAHLDAMPVGVLPTNPSELLQNARLDELMLALREQYDYVILDSAPLAVVSDTYLLNRLADTTICVTRANYTTFDALDLLNKVHDQGRLPNMVAVLNGVDPRFLTI